MKYKKGTFTIIPNKDNLKGKPSEMQALYFWLCVHADDKGVSYPTKNTLTEEAGCSPNTTDKYIKQLADEGFVKITNRRRKGTKEFISNQYQLLILSQPPKRRQPHLNNEGTGGIKNGVETISNINYIHLTNTEGVAEATKELPKKPEILPFSFEEEFTKLGDNTWVVKKIIYNYWKIKGFRFENKKQFDTAVARSLRPAKLLEGYTSKQILMAMDYCEKNYKDIWTLETVVKRIADLVNKK